MRITLGIESAKRRNKMIKIGLVMTGVILIIILVMVIALNHSEDDQPSGGDDGDGFLLSSNSLNLDKYATKIIDLNYYPLASNDVNFTNTTYAMTKYQDKYLVYADSQDTVASRIDCILNVYDFEQQKTIKTVFPKNDACNISQGTIVNYDDKILLYEGTH